MTVARIASDLGAIFPEHPEDAIQAVAREAWAAAAQGDAFHWSPDGRTVVHVEPSSEGFSMRIEVKW